MQESNTVELKKKKIPLTRIQKLISRRMLESKRSKPCYYIEVRADMTEFMSLRPKLRKKFGVKITTNAFYIYCLAQAIKQYPLIVGKLQEDRIKIADSVNIGFAVQAPQGLMVPVIKNVERKTLPDIAREEAELIIKARDNKLTLAELEGETIALSNLGAYDIDSFIGIIPPPASAILSVGNIVNRVVPIESVPTARKMVMMTLAADGTVIEGSYAAKFLCCLRELIENAGKLIDL